MTHLVVISVLVDDRVQSMHTTQQLAPVAMEEIRNQPGVIDAQYKIQKIDPKIDVNFIERGKRRGSRIVIGE